MQVTKVVTPLKVIPKDWLTNPNTINSAWQIYYRYGGKLVKLMGMNRIKDYRDRVSFTIALLKEEEEKLSRYGYNPHLKSYAIPRDNNDKESALSSLSFLDALNLAYEKVKVEINTRANIKTCLKYVSQYSKPLGLSNTLINDVRRKHLRLLFEEIDTKRGLSPRNWNAYRTYLMMLFEYLLELELVEFNPVKELKKRQEVVKERTVLNHDEREVVKKFLGLHYPAFYRFIQIFFHSGGRRTELLSLRVKDVDLERGEFLCLIKKGRNRRYAKKIIKEIAKPYWKEQIRGASPDDFVFSFGLIPGPKKIREEQITRRWKVHVKEKLGIEADLYSLKHLNTDETAALIGIEAAAKQNGHTSTAITKKHYAIGEEARTKLRLKELKNEF